MTHAEHKPFRRCFREPIPQIFQAAGFLLAASRSHRLGHFAEADRLIRRADFTEITAWTDSILGKVTEEVHGFVTVLGAPPLFPKEERPTPRKPTAATKRAVIERDGYHCRFCGIPVMRSETRRRIRLAYPEAARWGKRNAEQHAALQCLWLQYDHLLPNQRGGSSGPENIIVTCGPCNFGRMEHTVDEARLMNPFKHPLKPTWDGYGSWLGLEDF